MREHNVHEVHSCSVQGNDRGRRIDKSKKLGPLPLLLRKEDTGKASSNDTMEICSQLGHKFPIFGIGSLMISKCGGVLLSNAAMDARWRYARHQTASHPAWLRVCLFPGFPTSE